MRTKWMLYLAGFLGLLILLRWGVLVCINGQGLTLYDEWIVPSGLFLSMILGGAVGGHCMVWTGDHLMKGWQFPRAPLCSRLLENAFCFFIGGMAGGGIGGAVAGAAFGICVMPTALIAVFGGICGMWMGGFGGMPAGLAYGLFRGTLGRGALPTGSGPMLGVAVVLFVFVRLFWYPDPMQQYSVITLFVQILLLSALILMATRLLRCALLRWRGCRRPRVGDLLP